MDPVIIKRSRLHYIVPLASSLLIMWIDIAYMTRTESTPLSLLVLYLSIGSTTLYANQLCQNPKRIVIDDRGIWNRDWEIDTERWHHSRGVVRWKEFRTVFVKPFGGVAFVCFTVVNREELYQRRTALGRATSKRDRATGFGDLKIDITRYNPSYEEIAQIAKEKILES